MLGLADVTGELMRIAVHRAGVGDREGLVDICSILRVVCTALAALDGTIGRELNQKLSTMRQSVAKVESACYTLHVRLSELPADNSGCGQIKPPPLIITRFDSESANLGVD